MSTLITTKKNDTISMNNNVKEEEPREAIRLVDYEKSIDHDVYISPTNVERGGVECQPMKRDKVF